MYQLGSDIDNLASVTSEAGHLISVPYCEGKNSIFSGKPEQVLKSTFKQDPRYLIMVRNEY